MSWNGDKANEYFINKFNMTNPDSLKLKASPLLDLFDVELAIKQVYHICARSAWTKERLLATLYNAIEGEVSVDKEANNPEEYTKAYRGHAQDILDEINSGKLNF